MADVPVLDALHALTEVSGITDIDPEANFGTLGLDSLMLIDWISTLEESLNVEFDIKNLKATDLDESSIRDVIEALGERVVSA